MSMSSSTGELVSDGAIRRGLRMLPTAEEANAGDPLGQTKTCRFIRTTSLSCSTQSWAEPCTVTTRCRLITWLTTPSINDHAAIGCTTVLDKVSDAVSPSRRWLFTEGGAHGAAL